MDFPKGVLLERERLARLRDQHKLELLEKLMRDDATAQMWRTLERRTYAAENPEFDDGLWVTAFLEAVASASNPPRYQTASTADRKDLANRLERFRDEIGRVLAVYDLDFHVVQLNGKMFNGLYVLEDFGDANQARIKNAEDPLVSASALIHGVIGRCLDQIEGVKHVKQGANSLAIRFIRALAARNQTVHGEVLNAVVATAANAIYGTTYVESDIRNLLNRVSKAAGLQSEP